MATVTEFTSPADEFPVGSVFETLPGVTVELERLIPHETPLIPNFWVRGGGTDVVVAAFAERAGVADIRLIDSVEDEYLMRAEWEGSYVGILTPFATAEITVLSAVGTKDGWHFEVSSRRRATMA